MPRRGRLWPHCQGLAELLQAQPFLLWDLIFLLSIIPIPHLRASLTPRSLGFPIWEVRALGDAARLRPGCPQGSKGQQTLMCSVCSPWVNTALPCSLQARCSLLMPGCLRGNERRLRAEAPSWSPLASVLGLRPDSPEPLRNIEAVTQASATCFPCRCAVNHLDTRFPLSSLRDSDAGRLALLQPVWV